MPEGRPALPAHLLTLWPSLARAFHLFSKWDGRSGAIFISGDDQALVAARQVADVLAAKTIEIPATGVKKAEFQQEVGRFLDGSVPNGAAQFAGMDKLCVIIPRIDKQPKWLPESLKGYCDGAPRPFVLLLTCPNLEWMPSTLHGHLYICRKIGRPRKNAAADSLGPLARPEPDGQPSRELF